MKRIEILGPSGVGKTSFYNKLEKDLKEYRQLDTKDSFIRNIVINKKNRNGFNKISIVHWLIKLNLMKTRHSLWQKTIIRDSFKDAYDISKEEFNKFKISIDYLHNRLNERNEFVYEKYFYLKCLIDAIKELLIYERLDNENQTVIFDEGPLHKLPFLNNSIFDQYNYVDIKSDKIFSPAGIIVCYQEPEKIFIQSKKRRDDGHKTFSHGNLNDTELRQFTYNHVLDYDKRINVLKRLDLPILDIDLSNNYDVNKEEVIKFCYSLSNI